MFMYPQSGLLNGTGYAPDFTVTDLNGTSHSLYSYLDSGYVVVLDFLSITCGHCIMHTPGIMNSYTTNGPNIGMGSNNTARFIGLEVNASTDSLAVLSYVNNYNIQFPIANDIVPYALNYQMTYTPTFYIIYPDRTYTTICFNCVTPTSSSQIESLLDNAISAWPPIYGCTDENAINYDSLANVDDGSCNLTSYTIKTNGMSFSPDTLVCDVGDTINFILGGSHNAVEVDSLTFVSGGSTSNGGFNFGFGANGQFIPTSAQTYYYVCQPHVQAGMVGVIIANIYGCTDPTALNYDNLANVDNGECDYSSYTIETVGMSFIPDTIVCDVGDTINFILGTGHNAVQVSDSTWISAGNTPLLGGFNFGYGSTGYFIPDDCQAYYYVCQPHSQIGMKGVVISHFPPVPGCTDSTAFNYDTLATVDDGSCIAIVTGCTDPAAPNYNPNANIDDGSCVCCWPGCMDPLANNYDPNATVDDGSCTYPICTAKPTGLNVWDITDTRFRLGWDNMNTANCMVWKYNVRYRETGTTTWTTRSAGAGNGLCNFGLNNVEKLMINFNPNTTYDIRMRVLYCGADPATGWTGWTSTINVTLGDYCPDLANVTVQTFNGQQNKARFDWDTTGVYKFARLYTRVNVLGSPWTVQGGFGIYYPTFFKNIFTFTPGETYRVQANSFCSASLASYRGNLTPPVVWTQPGGSNRIEGGESIQNLAVYPNPSSDVFNVSFTSEDVQDLQLRIINIIGEELSNEALEQFVGEYTKAIDLSSYTKGVYFLEITTNDGVVNKKLILY